MNARFKYVIPALTAVAMGLTLIHSADAVNLVYLFEGGNARGLYDYDTDTQKSTFRTSVPFSAGRLLSLDVRPSDAVVFGLDLGASPARLKRLDRNTGEATFIGNCRCSHLSFQPGTSDLFGVQVESETFKRSLVTINPTNGNVTPVGDLPFSGEGTCAIEFLGDGTLILFEDMGEFPSTGARIHKVNPTNAQLTLIGSVTPRLPNTLGDLGHVGNRLFATDHGTFQHLPFLWEIDIHTGNATAFESPALTLGYGGLFALPPVTKLTISVASVSLKWPSVTGTTYQLQYQSPRTTNLWTELGPPIPGTDAEITVIDSVLDDPLRIYRLHSSP
jgi:hypothetical protein